MIDKKLAKKIQDIAREDQRIRKEVMKKNTPAEWKRMTAIDRRHTKECKEIIAKYGWPNFSLVGKKAGHSFWLIIQHSVHDRRFQKKCLKLITEAALHGQAYPKDVAYLADRLLLSEGKKQKYGTQFIIKNGKLVLQPLENKRGVNKRRAEMGLETIEEYISRSTKNFLKLTGAKK